jgi:uncharacterized DUF497 family protein
MVDYDPAKEAINLSKHGVSLERWADLDIVVTFVDDAMITAKSAIALTVTLTA